MKNFKISGLVGMLLLSFTIFTNSCANNEDSLNNNDISTVSTIKGNHSTQKFVSADFEYYAKQIGILHNDYLKKAFTNFNYNAPDFKKELLTNFSQIDKELYEKNYDFFINYTTPEDQEKFVLTHLTNPVSVELLRKFNEEATNSQNLKEFITNIDRDLQLVEAQLNENDYATLLVTAEVMKKSFEFWAPKEIGGTGDGDTILNNFNSTKKGPPKGWRGVIYADGLGAGTAFIGNAIVMGAGPVGVAAYFGSVAVSAGFASAMGSWA